MTLTTSRDRQRKPPLVGRQAELELLDGLLKAGSRGRAARLVLMGEPGIGKTRLLAELERRAVDFRTLRAEGDELEQQLAYATLNQLLLPLVSLLDRLPEAQERAIAALLGRHAAPISDALLVCASTLALLQVAAEEGPLLVLVDDFQWADRASRRALLFASRRLTDERVLVVMAARDTPTADAADDLVGLPVRRLGGLSLQESARLLGEDPSAVTADGLADVYARTGGNPLALLNLTTKRYWPEPGVPEQLSLVAALEGHYAGKVRALSETGKQAAAIAAVLDGRSHALFRKAAGAVKLSEDLSSVEEAGLVRLDRGAVSVVHPLARSAVLSACGPSVLRTAHRAAAVALAGDPAVADARAWHLAHAVSGTDAGAAAALAETGHRAAAVGASWSAMAALARAAELAAGSDAEPHLLVEAAENALDAGRAGHGLELLERLDGASVPAELLMRVELTRARAETVTGQPREALQRLERMADELPPEVAVWPLLEAVGAAIWSGEIRAAVRLAERAIGLAAGTPARLHADVVFAGALAFSGSTRQAAELIERVEPDVEGGGDEPPAIQARMMLSAWEAFCDRDAMADRLLAGARDAAHRTGQLAVLPMASYGEAVRSYQSGNWVAALERADAAVELAEVLGRRIDVMSARGIRGLVLAGLGREQQCREQVQQLLEEVDSTGAGLLRLQGRYALGLLALGTGAVEEALTHYGAVRELAEQAGVRELGVYPWASDHAETLVRLRRRKEAMTAASPLFDAEQGHDRALLHGLSARVRGLLAPSADAGADEEFERSLRWLGQVERPFELARTQLCYGEHLRRRQRPRLARLQLGMALDTFEKLGASGWRDRAARELAAAGGPPGASKAPPVGLTARELQVASEIAAGGTVREVARRLFISPKTVEYHLGRAYRKLGIDSRDQLRTMLKPAPAVESRTD